MARTVVKPGSWAIIPGTRLGAGHFFTEDVNNTDAPGKLAGAINDLYEALKPPMILDSWGDPINDGGTGSYAEMAQYKVPPDFIGTGKSVASGDAETLDVNMEYKVDSGDTAALEVDLSTGSHGATREQTGLTSATYTWQEVGSEVVDQIPFASDDDVTVIINGQAASSGSNLKLRAIKASWDSSRSTLPAGPYYNSFLPFDLDVFHREQGFSVEKMQRAILNLLDLKRRRTPGMICTRYIPGGWDPSKAGNKPIRARGYQLEHVTQSRVWLLAKRSTGSSFQATVTLTGQGVSESHTFDIPVGATETWQKHDFTIPRWLEPVPRDLDLEVDVTSEDVIVYGCCAWFHAITATM